MSLYTEIRINYLSKYKPSRRFVFLQNTFRIRVELNVRKDIHVHVMTTERIQHVGEELPVAIAKAGCVESTI